MSPGPISSHYLLQKSVVTMAMLQKFKASFKEGLFMSLSNCLGTHISRTFEYSKKSTTFTALPALTLNNSACLLIVIHLFSQLMHLSNQCYKNRKQMVYYLFTYHKITLIRFFLSITDLLPLPSYSAAVYCIFIVHLCLCLLCMFRNVSPSTAESQKQLFPSNEIAWESHAGFSF